MKFSLLDFLNDLGLVWKYAINGLIGGFIWSLYKKSKFWEGFRQVIIGGVVSGYFTPVVVTKFQMDLSLIGFTSFIIGMLGMVIVDSAYKYLKSNFKKWPLISKILFSREEKLKQ
jgi:uncharacterized membrane protein YeaQ/YmgE (transglycosylase-associated protein family)